MPSLSRLRARLAATVRLGPELSACTLSSLVLAGLAASFGAHAQTASTPKPIIEELRQQERERALREQQERTIDERLKPVAIDAQTLPDDELPCFDMHRLVLAGELAEDFQWALESASIPGDDWQDRCLGTAGINVLLARVQQAIIAKGFVTTRVLVGPQDLSAGTLTLTLVPSRVAAIRFKDETAGTSLRGAIPTRVGALVNLRDIEQGLENLKRLPTADADIQIEASTAPKGPQARPRITQCPMATGYWLLSATASQSDHSVAGLYENYVYSGDTSNAEVRLAWLLYRDASRKTTASVRAFRRASHNFIDDTEMDVQRRVVGGWEASLSHREFIGRATLDGTLAYRRGTGAFGAIEPPEDPSEGASRMKLFTTDTARRSASPKASVPRRSPVAST